MFPVASSLPPTFEFIVPASAAERNSLMVYAFGYFQPGCAAK